MEHALAYFRPRGIPGNYKIIAYLYLLETEGCSVQVNERYLRPEEYREPGHAYAKASVEEYVLSRVKPGDQIIITIKDQDVIPVQTNTYTVTPTGIEGGLTEKSVQFKEIHLVDLDVPEYQYLLQWKYSDWDDEEKVNQYPEILVEIADNLRWHRENDIPEKNA